jgi:hypothetical protein
MTTLWLSSGSWLGGWMWQGTQRASRGSSHAYTLDTVQFLDNARSKRLFKICLGYRFVNYYFRDFYSKIRGLFNFGCLLGMLFVLSFFQKTYPERRGFQIYYTNLPMFTIKSFLSYIACHDSLDPLFQTWRFGFKTRGLRDTCHQWLIFQIWWKIRTADPRLNWPSAWFYEST